MMTASASISMSPWKQNTEGDVYQVYKPRPSPKPRPMSSSPRYVRTWSQEEEAYLLEARRARVPYKDIAARLNKTDLACRLHYHQMVVARKNSAPEDSNIQTPPNEQYTPTMQYQHHRSDSLPPIATGMSPQMLLPAPIIREPSRNGSGSAMLNPNHRRSISQPQTPGKRQPTPSPPLGGVTKHSPISSARRQLPNGPVDLGRIQELYRDLAPSFWSNIAAAYSQDKALSPTDVEMAFFQGHGLGLTHPEPLSPNSSVETSPISSWPSTVSTISSATSQVTMDDRMYSPTEQSEKGSTKCSVNSLLNN